MTIMLKKAASLLRRSAGHQRAIAMLQSVEDDNTPTDLPIQVLATAPRGTPRVLRLVSFSFRKGKPAEADITVDVRQPTYRFYVEQHFGSMKRVEGSDQIRALIQTEMERPGCFRRTLVVGVGCEHGTQQSPMMVERLAHGTPPLTFRGWSLEKVHRDLHRST